MNRYIDIVKNALNKKITTSNTPDALAVTLSLAPATFFTVLDSTKAQLQSDSDPMLPTYLSLDRLLKEYKDFENATLYTLEQKGFPAEDVIRLKTVFIQNSLQSLLDSALPPSVSEGFRQWKLEAA